MRFQTFSASQMLSLMAATTFGAFLSCSLASRTAQMNAAAIRRAFLGGDRRQSDPNLPTLVTK